MSLEERVTRLEERLADLRIPPVRDEMLGLRDAHGARLSAIEARLTQIEHDVSETDSWLARRFGDIDRKLDRLLEQGAP